MDLKHMHPHSIAELSSEAAKLATGPLGWDWAGSSGQGSGEDGNGSSWVDQKVNHGPQGTASHPTFSANPSLCETGTNNLEAPVSSSCFSEIADAQSAAIQKLVEERTRQLLAAYQRMEREIAQRRRAEEQLKQYTEQLEAANRCLEQYSFMAQAANRAKSEFLSNVSHEIRTPLNGIIGFAEIILASHNIEEMHLQAQAIIQESEHLLALINDVLDDAKIEVGKLELEPRPLDLYHLLDSVQRTVRVQAEGKNLQCHFHLDPKVPQYVIADRVRLRQVLLNLLSNAVKFTERGSVTLRVELLGQEGRRARIRFWVIDTGIGIPKEKQSLVFQSFTQICGGTTRRYGGTGLGTSIAKKLVHLMEGEIDFESEPGQGTTFWFTVPLEVCSEPPSPEQLALGPESASEAVCRPARSARILVAEDYPVNQELARLHLEGAGHRVIIVPNGREAVRACKQDQYDLILMDLHMPDIDGYEATRQIRQLGGWYARVPILGVTADASRQTVQACREAGLNEVIVKPLRKNSFLAVVGRYVQQTSTQASSGEGLGNGSETANQYSAPVPTALPIRYQEALEDFGGNRSLLDQSLQQFVQTVEAQTDLIRDALQRGDRETVRREAHRIRGGAANLTAYPLAAIAGRLETLAKEGDPADALRTWDDFVREFQRLKEYLQSSTFAHSTPSCSKGGL
ncbi:MAG: ATP-binding protein [Thermoguttaceae bacterium]|nr:ATP-binding protein [Thermoguttaceae bacterium]MDW8039771.1 ATP-binding protein [Thermoguttaceae bacterium]